MEWWKGRIGLLLEQPELCYMTSHFLSFFGLRHAVQLYIFRIGGPHRIVRNMTPEECFTDKKPEVSHFHIFGSLTYSHVPSEKRTKLEPTTEKGIFVGYDETSKAFCIYLPSQRKVVVRREVKFEERAFRKSRELEQGEQEVPAPQVVT